MKKRLLFPIILSILLFSGCQATEEGQPFLQRPNTLSSEKLPHLDLEADKGQKETFGYRRYQKQQFKAQPQLDRDQLANNVTRLALSNQHVEEAAALVTSKYVLIAYDASSGDREEVAEQVKRSASSILPRFFKIYLTDDHGMFEEIERFQGLSTRSKQTGRSLEETIKEMQLSPQGDRKIRTEERSLPSERHHFRMKSH